MKFLLSWCTLWAVACAAQPAVELVYSRPVADVLGSTHVSGRYYFSDDDFLNEGADQILNVGMHVFKGWLTPGFRRSYPYNSDWPEKVGSLVELLQTPHYAELLDKPFTTYSFVVSEFKDPRWKTGLTPEAAQRVEAENYALAAYLLTRYANTGKTFILQNWEGDNALRAWEIDDPAAFEVARQGMVDWLNARQAGIDRARKTVGMEGVRVVGAVEMTRTPKGREPFEHPLVVDTVVPYTHADLYSLSTWGTRLPGDEVLLLAQLDYIAGKAPASDLYGEKNVMLGEFGAYEQTYTNPRHNYPEWAAGAEQDVFNCASSMGQLVANRKQLEYALRWGVQYALYWEVYCNGLRATAGELSRDANGELVASMDQLRGVWMIRPDGTKVPTWYYFRNLTEGGYIADGLWDWSRVWARSARLQRPANAPFVANQSAQPGSVIYQVDELAMAGVRLLHSSQNREGEGVTFYTSADGEQWAEAASTFQGGPELAGAGWSYGYRTVSPDAIPAGSRFLRVDLAPQSADRVRLNKVVAEAKDVADDPQRRYFRFAELDALLVDGQPIEGFDPALTQYRVKRPGKGTPRLEWILADPRLEVRVTSDPDHGKRTRVEVSYPGEAKKVYEIAWQ
ncbi:MAG: hypothetical protein Q7P63_07160 [Verrucomicrobiota bacterium JB022]|nr:hypothetical protein [Verrucomicrobiota bacterium JB022]